MKAVLFGFPSCFRAGSEPLPRQEQEGKVKPGIGSMIGIAILHGSALCAPACWQNVLQDDFSGPSSNQWVFEGVSNSAGQALIRYDGPAGRVAAEWDQAKVYVGAGDPYTMTPSRLLHPLAVCLTDQDSFRLTATLNLAAGSVVNTPEIYQIANVGLYDAAEMGPDRTMSDNWSGNSQVLKDGSDFVEMNYFINNAWGGPNVTCVIGAHIAGVDGDYTTGTNYLQTAMGEGHWLPEGTNLYLTLEYFGAATGDLARVAYCGVFTEPERTNALVVNNVTMSYWTQPMPATKSFRLTHAGFYNHVAGNWGGANGGGTGTFDDVSVDRWVPPGDVFSNRLAEGQVVLTWAAESGTTYYLEFCTNLAAGLWSTACVVEASGDTVTWTNGSNGKGGCYRVSR